MSSTTTSSSAASSGYNTPTDSAVSKSHSHALSNILSNDLLDSFVVNDSEPIFITGHLTLPHVLAKVLAGNHRRAPEIAYRLFPATLDNHTSKRVEDTDVHVIVPETGKRVTGMLCLSCTTREQKEFKTWFGSSASCKTIDVKAFVSDHADYKPLKAHVYVTDDSELEMFDCADSEWNAKDWMMSADGENWLINHDDIMDF